MQGKYTSDRTGGGKRQYIEKIGSRCFRKCMLECGSGFMSKISLTDRISLFSLNPLLLNREFKIYSLQSTINKHK